MNVQSMVDQMNAHFRAHDKAFNRKPAANLAEARAQDKLRQALKNEILEAGVRLVWDDAGYATIAPKGVA